MISVERLDIRIAQRIGKGIKKEKILYWFGVYRIRVYQPGYWVSNSSLKRNIYALQTFTKEIDLPWENLPEFICG